MCMYVLVHCLPPAAAVEPGKDKSRGMATSTWHNEWKCDGGSECIYACDVSFIYRQVLRALKRWDAFVFKTATAETPAVVPSTPAAEEDPRPEQKVIPWKASCLSANLFVTEFLSVCPADHHAVRAARHGKGERGCHVTYVVHLDPYTHIHSRFIYLSI